MRTIRLLLEYSCEPVWIYGEDGIEEDVGLPEELRGNKELDGLMRKVSREFDSQYINNEREFTGIGFRTKEEKQQFKQDLIQFSAMMREALKPYANKYRLVDDFHYEYY